MSTSGIIKMHSSGEIKEQVICFYYNWQFTKKQIVANETIHMGKMGRTRLYSSLRLKLNHFG